MYDLSKIKRKNICIMGLMGSGKSIIGKDLSKYLNFKFYDTDKEIELKTKKSVNEIFKEDGELYFRKLEEKICLELLTKNNCIISLGGGSIINKKIRKAINQNSSKKETLENLYNERRKFYEKADFIVNNDNDRFQVLEKIKFKLNSYAKENKHK